MKSNFDYTNLVKDSRKYYIASYYLSRFDKDEYERLGKHLGLPKGKQKKICKTHVHNEVALITNNKASTIKNCRDAFDSVHGNLRKGWYQNPLYPAQKKVLDFFQNYSHDQVYSIVCMILDRPDVPVEELLESWNLDIQNDYTGFSKKVEVNQRQDQSRFRKDVLNNFNRCCCLTGESAENLLEASHIVPWSDRETSRLDPGNGLCLSWIYHKLFDQGYFTLTNELVVEISEESKKPSKMSQFLLQKINDKPIKRPIKHKIKVEYLEYHRDKIFLLENFDE
ncbi:HNH endonuclease [Sodalinema gerasimenkoae]|uniref:HNH endonuclease n=1 Tax=Sodalinema gerasimenkoae TaxID=2862348 RepID=UPI0013587062|nr:HNH endonuclease [Sodalinema gerasimenkoae]